MDSQIETKQELDSKAKSNLESNPNEAVMIYKSMYEQYPDQFNSWDAFNSIKAMRLTTSFDVSWASELAEKYKDEKVNGLYGWLVFDKCVKGKERTEIINNEQHISSLINLSPQKNLKEDDKFPCPTTISILKLCDAHAENLFNARKINDLLSGLDYNLLSDKAQSIETQTRGEVELSSDLEKYFALKTKALLKLNEFEFCKELSSIALQSIQKFHNDNDLWFKMRIALSEDGLGNSEKSEELFKELLSSKAGSGKWFLYRDISQIYFEQNNFEKAWKYAVDATFYGNEPHFLIGLYLLQARILFKLNRASESSTLAELIASILKEQQWNDKLEYNKLFSYFKTDRLNIKPVKEIIRTLNTFWQNERYGNKTKTKGIIISIHHNGKGGKIKDSNGDILGFLKKDLVKKLKSIDNLKGASVDFYSMKNFEGKDIAESIEVLSFPTQNNSNNDNSKTCQNLEGEIAKILHDNERGKAGFIKCGKNEYYFTVSSNFHLSPKIVIGSKVIFQIIPAIEGKKEQMKILKIE
jgi:hypothetical protein